MAMEINGNLLDYSAKKQNYSSYAGRSKAKKTTDYANGLSKLIPSVDFRVGNACSSAKSGKTLTINPRLLEKMQNDPEQEKETKELMIKRNSL